MIHFVIHVVSKNIFFEYKLFKGKNTNNFSLHLDFVIYSFFVLYYFTLVQLCL